jgi:hypothetical protein
MAFNIQVTRITDHNLEEYAANRTDRVVKGRKPAHKSQDTLTSLIHVPSEPITNRYPVRIFDLRPQE